MNELRPISNETLTAGGVQGTSLTTAAGHLALVPTWLPFGVASGTTGNSAGSGGMGLSVGVISSDASAVFVPSNTAIAGPGAGAGADQFNNALINQHVVEMAGMGGDGGNGNAVIGGTEGATSNHAGSGGAGVFFGGLVSSDVAVFAPVNAAVAGGSNSVASANQTNNAAFLQGADQMAGIGGSGGDHNAAGSVSASPIHTDAGNSYYFTGDNYAGHGGAGVFTGTMIDVNVAIFSPINIAVAAAGGNAEAHQTNNVIFDQGGTQIAGIGGNGGGFNMASDTIFTGNTAAGSGGDGVSLGSMVDVNIGYFHPINIAVPAGGTADAQQIDHLLVDQHALQIAGIGGSGGYDNLTDTSHDALLANDILGLLHA
ncbi:hypothetical protein F9K96_05055 [Brucella anthropi]|uniref:hypothetical protein n=1 Tax=Brucella anthropi TaxID=529 RepID=UPI00124EC02D|nr:hypothetical protein [Brucella anthropi]KAB2792513.1 hypothetical protein F9K96_05055 [Brucella anthropi]QOD65893.1 hypothetical protein HGK82_22665 [Ochrobactrum sp. MT180101]